MLIVCACDALGEVEFLFVIFNLTRKRKARGLELNLIQQYTTEMRDLHMHYNVNIDQRSMISLITLLLLLYKIVAAASATPSRKSNEYTYPFIFFCPHQYLQVQQLTLPPEHGRGTPTAYAAQMHSRAGYKFPETATKRLSTQPPAVN